MSDKEIAELLAREAETAERNEEEEESRAYRRPAPPTNPSQVYSLRIPVDRLEQLRIVAKKLHSKPTALMRQWVLERLDEEIGRRASFSDPAVGTIVVQIKGGGPNDVHVNPEFLAHRIGEYVADKRNEELRT